MPLSLGPETSDPYVSDKSTMQLAAEDPDPAAVGDWEGQRCGYRGGGGDGDVYHAAIAEFVAAVALLFL